MAPASSQPSMSLLETLLLLLSLSSFGAAQSYTPCQPINGTCPANPALSTNVTFDFAGNTVSSRLWNMTDGPSAVTPDGVEFSVGSDGEAPLITSRFYIFFGRVETVMQAATGAGIISSVALVSDDLDEIDFEFVGNNASSVQSNFYGKGNTTTYGRAGYHAVDSPQTNFYNYTTVWTKEKLEWWVNGKLVRTLPYNDPLALGGQNYPQTPMTVRLGAWPAGKKGAGAGQVEWAGGSTDFSDGQSYKMLVKSCYVEDFSSGKSYEYQDRSGSWQSIKVVNGTSPVADYVWKPHGVQGRFNAMPRGARIAIVCAVLGTAGVLLLLLVFCCVRQRRAGRREKAVADAEFDKSTAELMEYRRQMSQGAFSASSATTPASYYDASIQRGKQQQGIPRVPTLPNVGVADDGARPMKSGWL